MYTRQVVCALTGIPTERFKTLARRNQLPTIYVPPAGASEENQDRAKERGWNWFTPIDILQIAVQERLMMQIGYADGFGADTAVKIVSNNSGDIGNVFWLASATIDEPSPQDIWIGYLGYTDREGKNCGGWNVSGSLAAISAKALKSSNDGRPARLTLVNISEVLRSIRHNAAKLNIQFPVPADSQ